RSADRAPPRGAAPPDPQAAEAAREARRQRDRSGLGHRMPLQAPGPRIADRGEPEKRPETPAHVGAPAPGATGPAKPQPQRQGTAHAAGKRERVGIEEIE